MKKLRTIIKTKSDLDNMLKILSDRVKANIPISENGMLDGFIISFMFSISDFFLDLILDKQIGWLLDGTIQKLEQIVIWIENNEDELFNILKNNC
jgi:hypothetical protein